MDLNVRNSMDEIKIGSIRLPDYPYQGPSECWDGKKWQKICTDFSPDCFEDETCERGLRLKQVLSEDIIELIKDRWRR